MMYCCKIAPKKMFQKSERIYALTQQYIYISQWQNNNIWTNNYTHIKKKKETKQNKTNQKQTIFYVFGA